MDTDHRYRHRYRHGPHRQIVDNRHPGNTSRTLSGDYHVYTDVGIANTWNTYRCLRILANEVILDQVTRDRRAASEGNQGRLSKYLLDFLFTDVCCSVPSFFQLDKAQNCPGLLGRFFLWPLYLVAATPYASELTREWEISQLESIGEMMGLLQATAVANVLRSKGDYLVAQRSYNDRRGRRLVTVDVLNVLPSFAYIRNY
jgi:hypothetical protein